MMKGFTHARLACGCRLGFREGVEGSPVTGAVGPKGPGGPLPRPASFLLLSSSVPHRSPQQELDLAVQAAQVVVCPALNGVEHVPVDPKQERLAVRHGVLTGRSSRC